MRKLDLRFCQVLAMCVLPSISVAAPITGSYQDSSTQYIDAYTSGTIDISSQLNPGGTSEITAATLTFSFSDDQDSWILTSQGAGGNGVTSYGHSVPYSMYRTSCYSWGQCFPVYSYTAYYYDYDNYYTDSYNYYYYDPIDSVIAGTTSTHDSRSSQLIASTQETSYTPYSGSGSEYVTVSNGWSPHTLDLGYSSYTRQAINTNHSGYSGDWLVSIALGANDLASLTATGTLDYFINPTGDFNLTSISLEYSGEYTENPAANERGAGGTVPEPGSLALIGAGIGLLAARRRRRVVADRLGVGTQTKAAQQVLARARHQGLGISDRRVQLIEGRLDQDRIMDRGTDLD